MIDYLQELPHEAWCGVYTGDNSWLCTCRRAETLAYVEKLEAENTLIDAASAAQNTLHERIAGLETERDQLQDENERLTLRNTRLCAAIIDSDAE